MRLGGIYALERIARDSSRDRATIIEILAALVRETNRPAGAARPSVEVVAALEVLSRLPGATERRAIDLRGSNLAGLRMTTLALAGADLTGASLEVGHLPGADLRWAVLDHVKAERVTLTKGKLSGITATTKAEFPGAYLDRADLQGATLHGVVLKAASLRGIDARGATLEAVDLEVAQMNAADDGTATRLAGAWLTNSNMTNIDVSGVDLRDVHGLTSAQRAAARSDASTRWPSDLG